MKYKKILIATILLLAILTVGAVSASEDADVLAQDSDTLVSQSNAIDDKISGFDDDFEGNFTINENYLDASNGGDTFATLNLQTAAKGKVVITSQSNDTIYEKDLKASNFYQSGDGFSYNVLVGDVDLSDISGVQFLNFNFYDSNDDSVIQEVYQIDKNKYNTQFVMYPAVYMEIYDGLISEDTEGPIVVVYAELYFLKYRSIWISDSDYTFGLYPDDLTSLTYFDHGIYSKNHVDGWGYYGITAARFMNIENFGSNLNGKTLSFIAYKMNNGLPQDRFAQDERTITFTDGGFYLGGGNNDEPSDDPTLILEVYGNEYMPIDYDDGLVFSIIVSGDDKTGSWKPIDELSSVRLRVASDDGTEFLNVNINELYYSEVYNSPGIIEHMFTLSEVNNFNNLESGDIIRFYLEVPPYPEDYVEYAIYFEEDGIYLNYENGEDEPEFQVAPILSVSADDINVGGKAAVNVLMNGELNGNVLVNVNNVNYTVNIVNGKGSLSVSGLARGTYDVTVTFAGDANYLPAMNSTKFNVNKISTRISAVYDATNKEITATLTNDATGKAIANTNVKFNINGTTSTVKTNSKGQAKLSTADLPLDTCTATISYAGNSKYKASKTTIDVTESKADISISAVYDASNNEIVATLTNSATGKAIANTNVKVNLNGEDYTVKTNSKGQAKVSAAGLPLGTYTATISYAGNSKYNPASTTIDIAVKTKVIVTDVYAYEDMIVAKLTNGATGKFIANANMIVEINGVKYNAKSDNKGLLTFSTDGLDLPSSYDLTISYRGNDRYTASTATVAVDLNKANMMITTNYHADKKKMVATLKNSKTGKAVSNANMIIDLNGVKTTYKSDYQGKITLPTADFAPGTYVGTVTYPGNARYNSISAVFKVDV